MSTSTDSKVVQEPVPDPDQAAAGATAPTTAEEKDPTHEAGIAAKKENVSKPAAILDHKAHLDEVPKAKVAPDNVTRAVGIDNEVPAPSAGDPDRAVEPDITDLGWSEDPSLPVPVLHGMLNESLWMLVRRFNNQTYRVRAIENAPSKDLDMYVSNKEQFSPDKLKATFERFYVTVVVGVVSLIKHIARLRSWSEPIRTSLFMVAYILAWILDLLVPASLTLVMVLILSPRIRVLLFPSAPLAAIDVKTGQAQVPMAGHLGSGDSLTGAAEGFKGEAVEQEASNFVGALGSVALSTAAGKSSPEAHTTADSDDDDTSSTKSKKNPEDNIPDPTNIAAISQESQSKAAGEKVPARDHTKKPMEDAIFSKLAPFMHILNNICDDYERFCNALSPTPPFSRWMPRTRLASAIVPIFLGSFFINETMIYKGTTFGLGFGLFGQPLIDRVKFPAVLAWLDKNIPDWRKYAELRYMLLRGVPTNAQLTVTLLRIGEANKAPLPPPPPASAAPKPSALHGSDMAEHPDLPPEYTEQMKEAQASDVQARPPGEHESTVDPKKGKKTASARIVGVLKGFTAAGVETALGVNRVKAKTVGSVQAQARLGVVQSGKEAKKAIADGPTCFKARYHGKKGNIYVVTTAASPLVAFSRDGEPSEEPAESVTKVSLKKAAKFSVAIEDIKEIRKVGGLGWKGKLIVGWALGSEVADGLEIVDALGHVYKVTAMGRRDEVFNRLIALGNQRWETY